MSEFTLEHAIYLEEALRIRRVKMWYMICEKYVIPNDLQSDVIEWIMNGSFEEKVARRKKPPVKVSQYTIAKVLKKRAHTTDVLHYC